MPPSTKRYLNSIILIAVDFISLILPALIIFFISNHTQYPISLSISKKWMVIHYFVSIFSLTIIGVKFKHYSYRKTFWYELKEIIQILFFSMLIEATILALMKIELSRIIFFSIWFLSLVFIPNLRMLVKGILNRIDFWKRETIIIGNKFNAIDAYKAINSEQSLGFKVINFISDKDKIDHSSHDIIDNIPIIYTDINYLQNIKNKQTQFIIAVEENEYFIRKAWIKELMLQGFRNVIIIPAIKGMPLNGIHMSFIFSHEMILLHIHQDISKPLYKIFKRTFDIIITSCIILCISPIFIFLYFKVRKDGGPAMYGHERVGQGGKKFKCLKFRSMHVNSKELLKELLATNENARKEWNLNFKLKNDPRVTKIGAFLRKTSLDELPQLFNVLKGDMSLVGPRPITEVELKRYEQDVSYYLLVKPGITGLWQVSGRSETDYETRVYFDIWYVKNWSIWNDIVILLKTIKVVLAKDGAY